MQLTFVLAAFVGLTYIQLGCGSHVAFTARADTKDSVKKDEVLVFPFVKTNIGNHYNSKTGVFTSNKDGVYVFSVTITCQIGGHIQVKLLKNSEIILPELSSPYLKGGKAPSSATATVSLKKGDTVKVVAAYDSSPKAFSSMSYFTGFYLGE